MFKNKSIWSDYLFQYGEHNRVIEALPFLNKERDDKMGSI